MNNIIVNPTMLSQTLIVALLRSNGFNTATANAFAAARECLSGASEGCSACVERRRAAKAVQRFYDALASTPDLGVEVASYLRQPILWFNNGIQTATPRNTLHNA